MPVDDPRACRTAPRSSAGTTSGSSSRSRAGSDSVHRRARPPACAGSTDRYAFAWSMASWSSTARLSAHPDTETCIPRPRPSPPGRGDLADDHLRRARRAEVHRGVAFDHEHDVAERGDVRPAGRRRTEQAADLRHLPGQADLVVEDVPGAAPAGEQLHLVGQPGAGGVDEPHDRHLLGERGLRRPHHLLDGVHAPHDPAFTIGSLATTTAGIPWTLPRPVTTPSAGNRRRHGVRQHPVLDERTLVDEQVDALPRRQLALATNLLQRPARQA